MTLDLKPSAFVRLTAETTQRNDNFAGYGDYDSLGGRLESAWRVSKRLRLVASVDYHDYSYPNAFAFDVPGQPHRDMEILSASIAAQLKFWRHLSLFAGADLRDVSSSDPRFNYSRLQIPVGVQWLQRF